MFSIVRYVVLVLILLVGLNKKLWFGVLDFSCEWNIFFLVVCCIICINFSVLEWLIVYGLKEDLVCIIVRISDLLMLYFCDVWWIMLRYLCVCLLRWFGIMLMVML